MFYIIIYTVIILIFYIVFMFVNDIYHNRHIRFMKDYETYLMKCITDQQKGIKAHKAMITDLRIFIKDNFPQDVPVKPRGDFKDGNGLLHYKDSYTGEWVKYDPNNEEEFKKHNNILNYVYGEDDRFWHRK